MEVEIGIGKSGRRAYGFDDIAIVPSRRTRDPEDVDISWDLDAFHFDLPLMASAMDGVVSPKTAIEIGRLGGLACLNLEGLWTRYEDTDTILEEISHLDVDKATARMQQLYMEPVKEELIGLRIREIKDAGVIACASLTPQRVEQFAQTTLEADLERDGLEPLVARLRAIGRFAQDGAIHGDGGVGRQDGQQGKSGHAPLGEPLPGHVGLGHRDPQHIIQRPLPGKGRLVHVGVAFAALAQRHHFEVHPDLAQQLAAAWTARGQVDARAGRRKQGEWPAGVGIIHGDRGGCSGGRHCDTAARRAAPGPARGAG